LHYRQKSVSLAPAQFLNCDTEIYFAEGSLYCVQVGQLQFLSTVLACNSIYQQNGIILAVTQYFANLTTPVSRQDLKTNSHPKSPQQQMAVILVGHPFHD